MSEWFNKSIAGFLGGVLATGLLWGGYSLLGEDKVVTLPEDFDIEDYVDVESLQGERGLRGFQGEAIVGPGGKDGEDGKDGKNASIDIDDLTDRVIDKIKERGDNLVFSFSGMGGNFSSDFEVNSSDDFEFVIKHFGSNDIDVSIEDEGGNINVLIDSSGHISYTDTRNLSEGVYIIRVSADGEWSVDIE